MRERSDAPEGEVALARPSTLAERYNTTTVADREDPGRIPVGMLASTALLVAASLSMTLLAGPISDVTDRAAQSVNDQSIYRDAVLRFDPDNPTRSPEAFLEPSLDDTSLDSQINHPTSGDNRTPRQPVTTEQVPAPVKESGDR